MQGDRLPRTQNLEITSLQLTPAIWGHGYGSQSGSVFTSCQPELKHWPARLPTQTFFLIASCHKRRYLLAPVFNPCSLLQATSPFSFSHSSSKFKLPVKIQRNIESSLLASSHFTAFTILKPVGERDRP